MVELEISPVQTHFDGLRFRAACLMPELETKEHFKKSEKVKLMMFGTQQKRESWGWGVTESTLYVEHYQR
jgi:hypothetical protein